MRWILIILFEVIIIKIINLKINFTRTLILSSLIIALLFILLAIIRLININTPELIIMNNENYTTILNDCHNNIDKYINKEILLSGYIFRVDDFSTNQFVVARDMLVSESKAQIVGFLCSYENAHEFDTNSWVEAKGIITKGRYYGEIPIIDITAIKKITTPNDIFVYPPEQEK